MRTARRRRARPGLIAVVIILFVLVAAVALTGTLIAAFSQAHPAKFASPLKIYPVAQELPGMQCPPGITGVVGQGPAGSTCFEVTTGITIRRVSDIHVERAKRGGYGVSISLTPADGKALARLTRRAAGQEFALTVRNVVIAVPRVDAPITKGHILITGNLDKQSADRIVRQLKGGRSAA